MSSNCNRFRYLIQQKLDTDLSSTDERTVAGHVQSCESCGKFEHQLQQVIMAAEEVPLPEDMLPPNPEALARKIMSDLPEQKQSFFAKLFGGLFGGGKKKESTEKTAFPHVSRKGKQEEQSESGGSNTGGFFGKRDDDHTGTTNRLKTIGAKHLDDSRDAQSQTKSLSEKMGFAPPSNSSADEQPLTLAESIRRKISESQKGLDDLPAKELDASMTAAPQPQAPALPESEWPPKSASRAPANMAAPPQVPGLTPPQAMTGPNALNAGGDNPQVIGSWGKPSSPEGWTQPADAPADAFGQNQAVPGVAANGNNWGGSWNEPPRAPQQSGTGPDWGTAPQGNSWEAPGAQSWAGSAQQGLAPAVNAVPAPPTPPATTTNMSNWGNPSPINPAPTATPVPTAPIAPAPIAPAPANTSWGATDQPAAGWNQAVSGSQPGAPAWGQAQIQAPSASMPETSPPSATWATPSAGQTTEGWAKPAEAKPATGNWSQPGPVDGWGNNDVSRQNSSMWAQTPAQSAQPQAPAVAQPVPQQAPSWGQQPAAVSPAPGWGGQAPASEGNGWSQEAPKTEANLQNWAQPQAGGNDWGHKQEAKPAAKAWSLEAEQIETGTWQAFSPGADGGLGAKPAPSRAWTTPGAASGSPPEAQSFSPAADDPARWDIPIQERMKMQNAQAPALAQAASSMAAPQPAAPPSVQPGPAQSAPLPNAASPKSPTFDDNRSMQTKSGWNFPVFEPAETVTQPKPQAQPGALWEMPAAPSTASGAPAPTQPGGMPGWGQPTASPTPAWGAQPQTPQPQAPQPQAPPAPTALVAPSAGGASRWEVPIQERQASAAQAAPQAAPTPANGLFQNLDDNAIDNIFKENLGVNDAMGRNVNTGGQAPQAAAAQPSPSQEWGNPTSPAKTTASAWNDTNTLPLSAPPWGEPAQAPNPSAPAWGDAGRAPQTSAWGEPSPTPPNLPTSSWGEPNQAPGGDASAWVEPAQSKANSWSEQPAQTGSAWGEPPKAPTQAAWGEPPQPTASAWGESPAQHNAPAAPAAGFGWNQGAAASASQSNQYSSQQLTPPGDGPKISAVSSRSSASQMSQPISAGRPPFASAEIQAPPPQPAQAAVDDQSKGLFNLDDSAMDKLFKDNLGVAEAAVSVGGGQKAGSAELNAFNNAAPPQTGQSQAMGYGAPPQNVPPSSPAGGWSATSQAGASSVAPQQVAQQQQQGQQGGLFSIDDSVIDRIFSDNLGVPKEQSSPQINVNETVNRGSEAASPGPLPPPKIEGVGRLDPKIETVESGSGRIASIGKFLLDQKDLEKIGKITVSDFADSKMRILTMEAAGELQALLHHIGSQEKVVGSVIVGHDGLLIANTMPGDLDAESIGVWALGVYMNTAHVIRKMGQDHVHQIVSRTPKGYLVIADFGGGLLVTVSDGKDTDSLIPLMRSITQLVQQ